MKNIGVCHISVWPPYHEKGKNRTVDCNWPRGIARTSMTVKYSHGHEITFTMPIMPTSKERKLTLGQLPDCSRRDHCATDFLYILFASFAIGKFSHEQCRFVFTFFILSFINFVIKAICLRENGMFVNSLWTSVNCTYMNNSISQFELHNPILKNQNFAYLTSPFSRSCDSDTMPLKTALCKEAIAIVRLQKWVVLWHHLNLT